MEVDDAALSDSVQGTEKQVLAVRQSGYQSAVKVPAGRQKTTTPELPSEPPAGQGGGGVVLSDGEHATATPLKLEVSSSEDEGSENALLQDQPIVREKIFGSSHSLKGIRESMNVAIKRKRFLIQRTGGDADLMGFDEINGEAILLKKNVKIVTSTPKEKSSAVEAVSKSASSSSARIIKKQKLSTSVTGVLSTEEAPKVQYGSSKCELKGKEGSKDSRVPISKTQLAGAAEKTNGQISTERVAKSITPTKPASAQDDFYKKPFKFGWKRELVWRSNADTNKDRADVYFITPGGKKLRTRNDIMPFLGDELTIDHFCFMREPMGAGAEFETVRHAKPSSRVSVAAAMLAAAPPPTNIGKRISKPKGPKGASPPPQGWTPTRALKVNNAALLSTTSASRHTGHGQSSPSTAAAASHRTHTPGSASKSNKARKVAAAVAATSSEKTASRGAEPCTIKCVRAPGLVPRLQCTKCLCLFHHECVGLSRHNSDYRMAGDAASVKTGGRAYKCEACLSKVGTSTKVVASSVSTVAAGKPAPTAILLTPNRSVVRARSPSQAESKFPLTITVVKGKKYVMVPKPVVTPRTENANDIENDLKQINESIRNSRNALAAAPTDAPIQPPPIPKVTVVDQSSKVFATNFFANVSIAYDSLLCILKYLKIHERSRAATVCKLWHLAAKDTSLWHTVRMKNSKVCDGGGFAAALRRGETKHLDLRKMLLSSTRSDEVWTGFSHHIGTVSSLETIDLCRCSAKVVESLFESNKNLRVLNAVAINDDSINMEHLGLLENLEELRLRANESYELLGTLHPLKALTQLKHLCLTSVRGLGVKSVEVLAELEGLCSLELGECGDFDSTFAETVLSRLTNLQRLRLENGTETKCCTLEIVEAAANMPHLVQLELVNFDIKMGFAEKLSQCINIRKLLIIPTYISQSATTNHVVLSAVQQIASTLAVFTWGVTVELLRVTALYVDQCEESTKKHHFDECIPVLKPVPGAPPTDEPEKKDPEPKEETEEGEEGAPAVPQIEILPLDKVESILSDNLPNIKFTIVKVPYHVTCKQQLVE